MPSAKPRLLSVSSVAIIGGGPTGLAAAKYLLAEKHFSRIDVFEQRSAVGGVWNYNPATKNVPSSMPIPQTSPDLDINADIPADSAISPLYDLLETNIPRNLMGFSDLDWPDDTQLFPKHETVEAYLEQYAASVRHLIHFSTRVSRLSPASPSSGWNLTTLSPSGTHTAHYDAIVVANGHYNVPHIPSFPSLSSFAARWPGTVTHSMFYKHPSSYSAKKVLLVGNAASGTDIAAQLLPYVGTLLHSSRSESFLLPTPSDVKHDVPAVARFLPEQRGVEFVNGRIETDIDAVLFCTGYLYSYPFLALPEGEEKLVGKGTHVRGLYQHLFFQRDPTLAFPALPQRVIPFPVAEAQAAVLARVWAGRLALPEEGEMKAWEDELMEGVERERDTHTLGFPKDAEYINFMAEWAGMAGEGGKRPPMWGERERWLRERFPEIKRAFQERGEGRGEVRTVEELGFDFEEWKREKKEQEKELI
ncbi:flavin-containing monooxygenase-like protein [Myriangium duriaei CBS 260.36]|uniref:Flavin-containing monooxygenase-like protein n=1 Tax=Myriangium duriaei CBS 260.36 TaxID=1168546 RepID=A0A9P4MJI8_9PEZI|nr:flavin-containing monooxygenase-like protein [Myriangium duriaei CBS 260.36]